MHKFCTGTGLSARIITILIGVSAFVDASARPGDLDPAFGDSGRVLLDPYESFGRWVAVNDLINTTDERLVVAASARSAILARFLADGTLDPAFGNGGFTESWIPGDRASAVIETSDGALVVAGSTGADFALWRFDADGVADTHFGTGGLAWRDVGGDDHVVSVVEQPDGGFVVAGTSWFETGHPDDDADIVLARFTPDGLPDETFGDGGVARIPYEKDISWEFAADLVADKAGNLIVVGSRFGGVNYWGTTVVARLTGDGMLDTSFGVGGQRELYFGAGDETGTVAFTATLDEQERIIVGGGIGFLWYFYLFSSDAFVARLLPEGTLDSSFGETGVVRTTPDVWADFRTLLIEPDGGILAGGVEYFDEPRSKEPYDTRAAGPYMRVTRLLADGTLDTGFGSDGSSVADFGHGAEAPKSYAAALVRQDDGRLVLAGYQQDSLALAGFSRTQSGFAGYLGFVNGEREVNELASQSVISVRRTGGRKGSVSVEYETLARTATEGRDYLPVSGRFRWADGDGSPRTIYVDLLDDALIENEEHFLVTLKEVTGGALLAASDTSVVILDDEVPVHSGGPVNSGPPSAASVPSGGGGTDRLSLLILLLLVLGRTTMSHARQS